MTVLDRLIACVVDITSQLGTATNRLVFGCSLNHSNVANVSTT